MNEAALTGLSFALVGPGRVGSSLALWAHSKGAEATAIGVRSMPTPTPPPPPPLPPPAADLVERLRCPAVELAELTTEDADLLLIAVSDPALDEVAAELSRRPQAPVVLHTSGSRGADALAPLHRAGCATGTLHPLKAFPTPLPDPAEARETTFGVGGDPAAVALASRLAAAWGAHAVEISDDLRPLYHFGATLAAGGAVTLLAAAADLARRLALPEQVAAGYLELARGALGAVDPGDPARSITGPAARGDRDTVLDQLDRLQRGFPELTPLAATLARETLRLLAATPDPPDGEVAAARSALAEALRGR